MGTLFSCFSPAAPAETKRRRRGISSAHPPHTGVAADPAGSSRYRSGRKEPGGEGLTQEQEQALAAAAKAAASLLLRQNGGAAGVADVLLDRSSSVRDRPPAGKKKQALPRSSSSRPRSLADPLVQPQQLINQDVKIDDLETNHFVLVHGGGFGAWCWYKTIALLRDGGFKATAIDLTGSGTHAFDSNNVTSLSQYVMPLTSFLEKLSDGEKVILVGHDFGGTCISYAMEAFASKVAKAVFVSAAMLTNGQSAADMLAQQALSNDLLQQARIFLYANGNDNPPTAVDYDKSLLQDLFFNASPAKDVVLASVSMRPIPFAPVLEKISLSVKNHDSIRRYYIETTEDNALPLSLQKSMCGLNPPERVFQLRGADHSPFFSKPQALHKYLVEIAKISS
ncbi:putative methylesterase 11, chloroplastic [Phoenix dactylifera]|uniref:Methylesterase 11, chloroplastic n=1 Tax=Phoenix dactylifera TaxID=42345 RepID=A0A8B7CS17_PHODC|nr:putative methylesterase 11, chloroplastic [Phoenix dactylifera]